VHKKHKIRRDKNLRAVKKVDEYCLAAYVYGTRSVPWGLCANVDSALNVTAAELP